MNIMQSIMPIASLHCDPFSNARQARLGNEIGDEIGDQTGDRTVDTVGFVPMSDVHAKFNKPGKQRLAAPHSRLDIGLGHMSTYASGVNTYASGVNTYASGVNTYASGVGTDTAKEVIGVARLACWAPVSLTSLKVLKVLKGWIYAHGSTAHTATTRYAFSRTLPPPLLKTSP